ncbi:hypothetical protein D3C87_1450200 [compost metagenome]
MRLAVSSAWRCRASPNEASKWSRGENSLKTSIDSTRFLRRLTPRYWTASYTLVIRWLRPKKAELTICRSFEPMAMSCSMMRAISWREARGELSTSVRWR